MQGIASLDYEVQNQPLVPVGGVEQFKNAADMLADFGREGDTYIVHAAEGETVIPAEVLDANPRMKKMIFKQMEDMGLDPERYIVGNELNSINPITGQPEFFLKKLFKSVKKVAKKVAPFVLPAVAPFLLPAMPLAFSSGLGSLVAAKLGGASTQDALKSALLTGGLAGLGSLAGGKGFFGTGTDAGIKGLFSKGGGQAVPTSATSNVPSGAEKLVEGVKTGTGAVDKGLADALAQAQTNLSKTATDATDLLKKYVYDPSANVIDATGQTSGESFLESIFSPSRTSLSPEAATVQAAEKAANTIAVTENALKAQGLPALSEGAKQKVISDSITTAAANFEPAGIMAQYGPLATAGATGVGAKMIYDEMKDKPQDDDQDGYDDVTGMKLFEGDVFDGTYKYAFDPSTFYGDNPYYNPVLAAQGGEIVGPGTGTSDSIPAMLSDGEFVMTANAVRGAGQGDRNKGAKRMYAMMKQYEGLA